MDSIILINILLWMNYYAVYFTLNGVIIELTGSPGLLKINLSKLCKAAICCQPPERLPEYH